MKVIVCIKQAAFVYHPLAIDAHSGHLDPEKLIHMLNPDDAVAVEAAVRIKENHAGSELTVITAGPPQAEEALRYAYALGADKMIRIGCSSSVPWVVSSVLAAVIRDLVYDIILCGKKAIDTNDNQVGSFIAEMLDLPQVSGIAGLEIQPRKKKVLVERYLGKGDREAIECDLPALFTVEQSMHETRYPTLPARRKSEKKEIEQINLDSLKIDDDVQSQLFESMMLSIPRPKPKKVFTPDSRLSPVERLQLILSGGMAGKRNEPLEGTPEYLAEKIIEILDRKKII